MNEDILKKTCCFTGHRDISKIKAMELKLDKAVSQIESCDKLLKL